MNHLLDHLHGALTGPESQRHRASLGALVGSNLLLMFSYAVGWISLGELMWTYWLQSVAIGAFNFRRMRRLKRFTTDGLSSNGRPVPPTEAGKRSTARFFLVHYGFFHLVYAAFLSQHTTSAGALPWLIIAAVSFAWSEWNVHARHLASDADWEPNLGVLLFQPYVRIIPMHLAILASNLAGAVLLPLKLGADVAMYLIDENIDAKRVALQASKRAESQPISPGVG